MASPLELFEKVEPLPTAPAILPKLLTALSDPDVNVDVIVHLVVHEPTIAAKVLKSCNSAFFAGAEPTGDISEAIYRIGFYNVYRLVVTACGQNAFALTQSDWGLDIQGLWKHSVVTALAAEILAEVMGEAQSDLFTAGLLHDFGKLIFAGAEKAAYGKLTHAVQNNPAELLPLEKQHYQIDHAELGGELLRRWNFPLKVIEAVRFHHSPEAAGDFNRLAALITIADRFAHLMYATEAAKLEAPGLQYAFESLEFSEDRQKLCLERLRGMLGHADLMSA